jgi:hypothetical protein
VIDPPNTDRILPSLNRNISPMVQKPTIMSRDYQFINYKIGRTYVNNTFIDDIKVKHSKSHKKSQSEIKSPIGNSMPELLKVSEPPHRNFFQSTSVNKSGTHNKQSQAIIKKMFESDQKHVPLNLHNSSFVDSNFELPHSKF